MTELHEVCFNCKKTFNIFTKEIAEIEIVEPETYCELSFCCEECQKDYYENVLLKVITKTDLGIDIPIESRFEILDLR